jgi:hypothetical protein
MRHELLAITDPEDGFATLKDGRVHLGALGIVDTGRPARDDDATAAGELSGWCIAGLDLRVNAEVPNFAGDQMAVLTARV